MSPRVEYPSALQMFAAVLVISCGVLMNGLQPVEVGVLLNEHRIDLSQVGQLAMTEILMLAAGMAFASFALPLRALRAIAVIASVVGFAFNVLSMMSRSSAELLILRAAAAFVAGMLVWAGTAIVVRTRTPSLLFAVSTLLQLLTQGVFAALLSAVIVPKCGWRSIFGLLAGLSLLCTVATVVLPRGVRPLPLVGGRGFRWEPSHFRALGVAFLQVAAMGALWAYIAPAGQTIGFAAEEIQMLISLEIIIAMFGALAAMLTVQRWNSSLVVALTSWALAGIAALIYRTPRGGLAQFSLLLALFQLVSVFVLPYQLAFAFRVDVTGRVATVIPPLRMLGQALGAYFASLAVANHDVRPAILMCAAIAGISIFLMLPWLGRAPARA